MEPYQLESMLVQFPVLSELRRDISTAREALNRALNVLPTHEEVERLSQDDIPENMRDTANCLEVRIATEIREDIEKMTNLVDILELNVPKKQAEEVIRKQDELMKIRREKQNHLRYGGFSSNEIIRIYQSDPRLPILPQIQDKKLFDELFLVRDLKMFEELLGRFKFLGASLLDSIISQELFSLFTSGRLTELEAVKNVMISDDTSVKWAQYYHFDRRLNVTESQPNYRSICVTLFQSYIAAILIDNDYNNEKLKSWLSQILQHGLKTGSIKKAIEEQENKKPRFENIFHESRNKSNYSTQEYSPDFPFLSQVSSSNNSGVFTGQFADLPQEEQVKKSKDYLYSRLSPSFVPTYPIIAQTTPPELPSFETVCVINGEVVGFGKASNIKTASAKAAYDAMTRNHEIIESYEKLRNDIKNNKSSKPPPVGIPFDEQLENILRRKELEDTWNFK